MFGRPPMMYPGMQRRPSPIVPILCVIVGLYFILPFFKVIPIPAGVLKFNNWIELAGGILLVISAVTQFMRITRGF